MNSLTKIVWLTIVLSLLSGCAMTNEHMALNYQTTAPSAASLRAATKTPIHVGPIADVRDENPYLIIHKENVYGETSAGYLSNQKITDIMRDALTSGLRQIGYRINNNGYTLEGDLTAINTQIAEGWVKGTLIIKTSVNLKLTNPRGTVIWLDTITGHGKTETAFFTENDVRTAFNKSLDSIVHQLQESRSFRAAMK